MLGSQIIKDNEIGSGHWEGPLLKEMKSEEYTMIGASDLSPRQTLVSTDKMISTGEKAENGKSSY